MDAEIKERLEKLSEAKRALKERFVGLDNIIDDIIKSITPWYVTPEVVNRPTVISLWGMTGTGKSSVVKKLVELLNLEEKTISFDCGREADGGSYGDSLTDKITDLLGNDEESLNNNTESVVFVFDEFQYARTLDEDLREVTKPALRPIWNIIDDGFINVYESRYSINAFQEFLDDSICFVKDLGERDIQLNNGKITNEEDISLIKKSTLGIFHLNSKVIGEPEDCDGKVPETIDLFSSIGNYVLKVVHKKLNSHKQDYGDEILDNLRAARTFSEFVEILNSIRGIIFSPKVLNCTKSLVFIVGNLDEAFKVQSNLDHDGDADTFYDITSKVSVTDIKEALKKRFRAEQIARLGNNLIKYPTLTKKNFKEIINREITRVLSEFKKSKSISVTYDSSIVDLIYFEGVCPTQGVRPVFTTISAIFTPMLSEIILHFDSINSEGEDKVVHLYTETSNFKINEVNVILDFSIDKIKYPVKLQLGELREPQRRKTRYICSVHESGHAVMMASVTGKLPTKIVSVDSSKGGACYTYDKDRHSEIPSKRDIDNNIKISYGGYIAEKVIFGDSEINLLGSNSDIQDIWDSISEAAIYDGYFGPIIYNNYETLTGSGNPGGLDMMRERVFYGNKEMTLYDAISLYLKDVYSEVVRILEKETKLIANMSMELAETGSMTDKRFKEYIDKFGSEDLKKSMEQSKKDLDYSKYEQILKGFL